MGMQEEGLMDTDKLYEKLGIDKKLVTDFSIIFSRFEYALKRTDKYVDGDEKGVKPDWDKFAKEHNSKFTPKPTTELDEAVKYLKANPPKKQIIKDGVLAWADVPQQGTSELQQILCAVRRVRNNLFHGGKFPDGVVYDSGRDVKLLQSCITILEACLSWNDEVKRNFWP